MHPRKMRAKDKKSPCQDCSTPSEMMMMMMMI
jgi:hypothetical protein